MDRVTNRRLSDQASPWRGRELELARIIWQATS